MRIALLAAAAKRLSTAVPHRVSFVNERLCAASEQQPAYIRARSSSSSAAPMTAPPPAQKVIPDSNLKARQTARTALKQFEDL